MYIACVLYTHKTIIVMKDLELLLYTESQVSSLALLCNKINVPHAIKITVILHLV